MIYPAAKVVLCDPTKPKQLLLIYREVNGSAGYEAAGGRVEADFKNKHAENFELCAHREIKEEVGVDIKLLSYLGSYSFFWDLKADTCSSCVVFLGQIVAGEVSTYNLDPSECAHESRWVDVQDILENTIAIRENHRGLRDILINAAHALSVATA